MSGGSRGIGLAIAVRAAAVGANVALIAKTAEPHRHLPGTVYTAAAEIVTYDCCMYSQVTDSRRKGQATPTPSVRRSSCVALPPFEPLGAGTSSDISPTIPSSSQA